jgi:predicted phosphate transport protein (TIGR00153 family)
MAILFRSSKALQASVDEYLDKISQGVLAFQMGVKNYLDKDEVNFESHLKTIASLESTADMLRRKIENDLYSHSLIPEHRGDVLGLLESIDNLVDTAKTTLTQFAVERPFIPEDLSDEYKTLTDMSVQASENIVKATRAFFKDVRMVSDHSHKVYFYEKEVDVVSDRIKRHVFRRDDLDLCQKMHLRYFALHIENLSDEAEKVADRLSIYAIKRSI